MCLHEKTKTLDTRRPESGLVVRRLECIACGHRYRTWEVHETVVRSLGQKLVLKYVQTVQRGFERQALAERRRTTIEQLLAEGWKPTAIAHYVGCSDARVTQIRRELAAGT